MKRSLSSLLMAAVLAWLAPNATAQVVATTHYGSTTYASPGPWGAHGYTGGYVLSRVWVPGQFEIVHQQVWVPGCTQRVWVEPVYGRRVGVCGNHFRVLLRAGYWKNVYQPGHYETRSERVWRAGHWAPRGSCN